MTRNRECFTEFSSHVASDNVVVANNEKLSVTGVGSVEMDLIQGNLATVSNVCLVPGLSTNLLSVNRLVRNGTAVLFDQSGCRLFDARTLQVKGVIQATATEDHGIYSLNLKQSSLDDTFSVLQDSAQKL